MKIYKFILPIILVMLTFSNAYSATLWDFFNGNLPSISERKIIYGQYYDDNYTGTAQQNINLLERLTDNSVVNNDEEEFFGAALPQAPALFQTSLLSSIDTTATSMTLTQNSLRGGGSLSGYNCFTIDEGTSISEFVCGSVSGTSVTSLLRGIDPTTGTTSISSLKFAHRRGAEVKITDYPIIQIMRNQLSGVESIDNPLSYSGNLTISSSTQLVNKYYVDNVAIAGAPDATESVKGISELATQIEMASSTAIGATGASLVLKSQYATSSPYTTGLYIPVTRNDGKLNPNFIATTSADTYNFGGQVSLNSTTTIAGSSSSKLTVNTVPYAFPSSQGSSSTYLQNNGSGSLSWSSIAIPRYTYATTSDIFVTNGYATTSANFVIPALTASSTIQFKGNFQCDNTSNGDQDCSVFLKKSTGETITQFTVSSDQANVPQYGFDITVSSLYGGSSQWAGIGFTSNYNALKGVTTVGGALIESISSVDLTSASTLQVVIRSHGINTSIQISNYSIVVNP